MQRLLAFLLCCLGLDAQPFQLNDPVLMAATRPRPSSSPAAFNPTNILGLTYWFHSADLPMGASTAAWTDRVSSVVFPAVGGAGPTNTPLGLFFDSTKPFFTNIGITLPTNYSMWAVVGIPATTPNDSTILMDSHRADGLNLHQRQWTWWFGGSAKVFTDALPLDYPINGGLPLARAHVVWANGVTYTNGVTNNTSTTVPNLAKTLTDIGNDLDGHNFNGYISEIAIFTNVSLTLTDSSNLFNWWNTFDATNVTSGLLGWWKLDENSGTNITDSSGNGLNGWTTASTNWTTGQINSAIQFDGEIFTNATFNGSQYCFIPSSTNSANSGTLSFSLWFKSASATIASDPKVVLSKQAVDAVVNDTRFPGWEVHYDDGSLSTYVTDGTHYVWGQYIAVSDQQWHHYVCAMDSTGTNLLQYLDGIYQNTGYIHQDAVAPVYASTNNIMMGWNFDTATVPSPKYCPGSVDDVRIFNRTLSDAEVVALYKWSYWSKVY